VASFTVLTALPAKKSAGKTGRTVSKQSVLIRGLPFVFFVPFRVFRGQPYLPKAINPCISELSVACLSVFFRGPFVCFSGQPYLPQAKKKPALWRQTSCDPDWIQTNDLLLRRQLLYSTELPDHFTKERAAKVIFF
jgi:hypothetical protein